MFFDSSSRFVFFLACLSCFICFPGKAVYMYQLIQCIFCCCCCCDSILGLLYYLMFYCFKKFIFSRQFAFIFIFFIFSLVLKCHVFILIENTKNPPISTYSQHFLVLMISLFFKKYDALLNKGEKTIWLFYRFTRDFFFLYPFSQFFECIVSPFKRIVPSKF